MSQKFFSITSQHHYIKFLAEKKTGCHLAKKKGSVLVKGTCCLNKIGPLTSSVDVWCQKILLGNTTTTNLQQTETAPGSSTDISTLFNRCKSNLRDLIVYFQSITKSPGANRNIIPFKFSFYYLISWLLFFKVSI